jgi:putative transposase
VVVECSSPAGMHRLSVLTASVRRVKQVVKVRMLPTDSEAAALGATLSACNSAASWLAAAMHEQRVHRKYDVDKRFYTELKERFGLSAQPAIR